MPVASRPHLPGYRASGRSRASGLLPWSWAEQRLRSSRQYWLATSCPAGHPHVLPVRGVWHDDRLWCSGGARAGGRRTLAVEPRCTVTTEGALDLVVVEGTAQVVTDGRTIQSFLRLLHHKYPGADDGSDLLEPGRNAFVEVRPRRAFGLAEDGTGASPTRWTWSAPAGET